MRRVPFVELDAINRGPRWTALDHEDEGARGARLGDARERSSTAARR